MTQDVIFPVTDQQISFLTVTRSFWSAWACSSYLGQPEKSSGVKVEDTVFKTFTGQGGVVLV